MEILRTHIHKNTFTLTEAYQFLSVLRQVLEKIFFTQDTHREIAERYYDVLHQLSENDKKHLAPIAVDFLSHITTENVHDIMHDLRVWLEEQPVMTLYVPVQFDADSIASIGTWCRAEIAPDLFLELIVEPSVVGGCAFIYRSSYHDVSLHARFREHPDMVSKMIATYESV